MQDRSSAKTVTLLFTLVSLAGAIDDAGQHLETVARQARLAAESSLTSQAVNVGLEGARAIPRLYRRTGKEVQHCVVETDIIFSSA